MVLVWAGVTMFYFRVPYFDVFVLSNDWIPLVTILWLLVMTEAINLIDGLDGLATGIVAIASAAFFLYSRHLGDLGLLAEPNIGPLVAAVTFGACIGFLPHNFNPAKIFMGDSGALLLGLMLAISTSVVGGRADPAFWHRSLFHSSFWVYPFSTCCLPLCVVHTSDKALQQPTRGTCITAS
jgi:UDP-GlcNAc:undecaprenyl-phosphate GlcNAc-1-phosphate transferase